MPGKGVVSKIRESASQWSKVSSREFVSEEHKDNNLDYDGFEYMRKLPLPSYHLYLQKLISRCDPADERSKSLYETVEKYMRDYEGFSLKQPVRMFDSDNNFLIATADFKRFLLRKIDNLFFSFM